MNAIKTTSFPQRLIASFLILLVGIAGYTTFLFWRVRTAISDMNDFRSPALHSFTKSVGDCNNAVQECFAYAISGEVAEKREFEEWADSIESESFRYWAVAKLQSPERSETRQRYLAVSELQRHLRTQARTFIAEFESNGVVGSESFEAFEHAVDAYDGEARHFLAAQQAEFDGAKTVLQRTLNRTDREILILGTMSMGLCISLLVLLVSNFREYERRRDLSQKSVRESERRFRDIFNSEPQCIKLLDSAGELIDMNPAGLEMIDAESIDEVKGASVFEIVTPHDRARFIEACDAVFAGESNDLEFEIISLSGKKRSMQTRQTPLRDEEGNVICLLAITQDVTEQKRDERELAKHRERIAIASRVNMMGEMASSIAHELNQPLSALANYSTAMEKNAESDRPDVSGLRQCAVRIREQAIRAGDIVRGLRNLIKQQKPQGVVNLNKIIRSSVQMMEHELRQQRIELREYLDDSLLVVEGDAVQIQQVLLNIVLNAIDAMSDTEAEDRVLSIMTRMTEKAEVELIVEDRGPGIEAENVETVFNAFFTTKPEGMGMGLAISRSIAEAHGGKLLVESAETRGTLFRLTLPSDSRAA